MKNTEKIYKTIWKWHFYAGVFCAPILAIVAFSGAILVYQQELEPLLQKNLFTAQGYVGQTQQAKLSRQFKSAKKMAQNSAIQMVIRSKDPRRTTIFAFGPTVNPSQKKDEHSHNNGPTTEVFVDPYTAKVMGKRIREESFFANALKLHRNLGLGLPGRILVELATSWSVMLILSGIYLWWPKSKFKSRGVFSIRIFTRTRTMLRDLHAVSGAYFSVFILILSVSGLVYSAVFGYVKKPIVGADDQAIKLFRKPGSKVQTVIISSSLSAPSKLPQTEALTILEDRLANLDQHESNVTSQNRLSHPSQVILFPKPTRLGSEYHEPYTVLNYNPQMGYSNAQVLFFDQFTGNYLDRLDTAKVKPLTKALFKVYSWHIGTIFGQMSKAIAFFACLVLAIASILGIVLWALRKPKDSWGLPKSNNEVRWPRWVKILTLILSATMPLLGISIILVFSYNKLRRRYTRWHETRN